MMFHLCYTVHMSQHSIRVWPEIYTQITQQFPALSQSNAIAVLMAAWPLLTPEQQLAALKTKATDRRSWVRSKTKPRTRAAK